MSKVAQYRKCGKIGGGGYQCPCCGPTPGKEKTAHGRQERAQLNAEAHKEIREGANHVIEIIREGE